MDKGSQVVQEFQEPELFEFIFERSPACEVIFEEDEELEQHVAVAEDLDVVSVESEENKEVPIKPSEQYGIESIVQINENKKPLKQLQKSGETSLLESVKTQNKKLENALVESERCEEALSDRSAIRISGGNTDGISGSHTDGISESPVEDSHRTDGTSNMNSIRKSVKYAVCQNSPLSDTPTVLNEKGYEKALINERNLFWFCFILAITAFPLGWDVGTISNLISHHNFPYQNLTSLQVGIIVSSFNAGCLIGCLTLPKIKTNLKHLVRVSTVIYLVGSIIEMISLKFVSSHWGFILGRFLCGISCGSLCVISPLYMNELIMDECRNRGLYLSLWQTVICFLILLGNFIHFFHTSFGIGYIYFIQGSKVAFVIIINGALFLIPTSIRFAITLDTHFLPILEKLYKNLTEDESLNLQNTFREKYLSQQETFTLKNRTTFNNTVKCCFLMGSQQLTGINYFFYYGASVFQTPIALILLSLVNFFGSISNGFIFRFFKPRSILITGSIVMFISMTMYSSIGPNLAPLLIVLSCIFIFFFAISWGPCSGMITNSISNNSGDITSIAVSVNWIMNWIITIITPILIEVCGFRYGFLFSLFLVVMGSFVYFYIGEVAL